MVKDARPATRTIWAAPLDRVEAEQVAKIRRGQGYKVRIYPRTVRAEGLACMMYVVVSDRWVPEESKP